MDKNTFYSTPVDEFDFIPFDIETTGFLDTDLITTFTLEHDGTYHAWLNTDGRDAPDNLDTTLSEESGLDVTTRICENDGDLLFSVRRYIDANINRNTSIFTAYNGERWKGGFDIRFIRSVCLRTDAPFPFTSYAYTDLMPLFNSKDRFNVTHSIPNPHLGDIFTKSPLKQFATHLGVDYTSSWTKSKIIDAVEDHGYTDDKLQAYCDQNGIDMPMENPGGLVPVYKRIAQLKGWPVEDCDPFGPEESEKAVTAFQNGDFVDILLHNLADVEKTTKLASLIPDTRSIPKNEYQPTFF